LDARRQLRESFLIEDMERGEADVGELFLAQSDFVIRCTFLRWHLRGGPTGCRRCTAGERKRQCSGADDR
jgi:hypothetical protein